MNATFYRLPRPSAVANWVALTPPRFVFTIKMKRELDEWAARVGGWRRRGIDVYAYFNNDWEGYAIENAIGLKQRLGRSPL